MINLPAGLANFMKGQKLDGLKPFAILFRNKWVLDDESESESGGDMGHFELDTANPIDISAMIAKPNTLSMTLDVNEIAQYNCNNITITLADTQNRFIEGVPGSYFPDGYQLYGSKVVLYYGTDSTNRTPIFTGVIKDLPTHKPEKYQVDLKLVSPLEMLKDIEARDFSNKVFGEVLTLDHTGDNGEEYYKTANEGVGGITALYANGVKLYEGVDYNVTELDDLAVPALIEVVNSSVFGQTFTVDYYYWKRALSIEQIVAGLVALGGYDSTNTDIQPVIWQNEVRNPPVISPVLAALGYYEDAVDEYKYNWSGLDGVWYRNRGSGDRRNILPDNFDFACTLHTHTSGNEKGVCAVGFGDEYSSAPINYKPGNIEYNLRECGVKNGFSVRITKSGSDLTLPIGKNFFVYQIVNEFPTLLYTENFTGSGRGSHADFDVSISRRAGGEIKIFANGVEVCSFTDNTDLTYQRYFYYGNDYGLVNNQVWNIYNDDMLLVGPNLTNPCIVTEKLDKTVDGITWGAVQADIGELDGQTYSLTAYFSNDGTTWSAGTNYNLDTDTAHSERYMYYILGISNEPDLYFDITDPRTYFYATNLVLNMVALGSRTVLEALQDLALISGYEFGVDRNGVFFFRPRVASTTPIYEMAHGEIVKVDTVKKNLSDFFTKLTLSFAQVPLEFYANTGAHPNPIDKYGVINKEIDKPDIVNYDNPELAQAIGPQLLEIYSSLPETIQAVGKLNLALELGDIVNLKRNYPLTANPEGSEWQKYTRQDTYYRACKITGMNYNFDKRQITYTLRSVSDSNNSPAPDIEESESL